MKKIILILFVVVVLSVYVHADLLISNPIPSNNSVLSSGTTGATLSVETDINANCRYWNTSGQDFSSMTAFTNTGELSHNSTISGLQDAQGYDYYIKCQNISNLTDISDDYHTHFFVLDFLLEQCFPNQLGYWTFDQMSGNIVYDILGSNYGTVYGTVTTNPGMVGDGFNFNGVDSYINITEDIDLANNTISFWITPDQDYGVGSGQTENITLFKDGDTEIIIDTEGRIVYRSGGEDVRRSSSMRWSAGENRLVEIPPENDSRQLTIGSGSGSCFISGNMTFSASEDTMGLNSFVDLSAENGCPPFNWTVSGTGFSIETEIESNGTNRLNASGSACGAAEVTVIDNLGRVITGSILSTAGQCISCGNASIGYTTQQMSVNGVQTLTVEEAVNGSTYDWAISSGGGSLSSATGTSVDYTAPSTNPNCDSNPTLSLSVGGNVCDTLNIAVNAITTDLLAYYEVTHEQTGDCTHAIYKNAMTCQGDLLYRALACDSCSCPALGSCTACCCDTYYDPPGCWGNWQCDEGGFFCFSDQLLNRCNAGDGCAGMSCNEGTVQDARTESYKGWGCCPAVLLEG